MKKNGWRSSGGEPVERLHKKAKTINNIKFVERNKMADEAVAASQSRLYPRNQEPI